MHSDTSLIPSPHSVSKIVLVCALAKAEFEGDEYYKADIRPRLLGDDSEVDTSVYLWQDRSR